MPESRLQDCICPPRVERGIQRNSPCFCFFLGQPIFSDQFGVQSKSLCHFPVKVIIALFSQWSYVKRPLVRICHELVYGTRQILHMNERFVQIPCAHDFPTVFDVIDKPCYPFVPFAFAVPAVNRAEAQDDMVSMLLSNESFPRDFRLAITLPFLSTAVHPQRSSKTR